MDRPIHRLLASLASPRNPFRYPLACGSAPIGFLPSGSTLGILLGMLENKYLFSRGSFGVDDDAGPMPPVFLSKEWSPAGLARFSLRRIKVSSQS